MKIFKWQLEVKDRQLINIAKGAKLLTAQVQYDCICVWALCDEKAEKETRELAIYGTGNPIPEVVGDYVGTCQLASGSLVFHVFDLGTKNV